MLKKSLKYIFIATVNLILLTFLLAIWTDRLETAFEPLRRPVEFLKIIGITLLCLVAMRITIGIINRRKNVPKRKKIIYAALVTLIISSYLYGIYSIKAVRVVFNSTRHRLVQKIYYPPDRLNGIAGNGLTQNEYAVLNRIGHLRQLPPEAENISFTFDFDGFLPDYSIRLDYYVPLSSDVERIDNHKSDFIQYQTYDTIGVQKHVIYEETLM